MKLRQLHINRFGHFHEFDLVFPGHGLQVIYGPNEAGKTTLLQFLRGVLFDFPARSPYDFSGPGTMSGVAHLELRDGRKVELARRKGNKDKVSIKVDGQPTDLDDVGWLRMLDHADRGLFESVFAFGLDQLSQGEESLRHESLQSALFSGSLGGTSSPDKVIADLTRQADELFKKGGSKPTLNALLADLKKLSKEIKDRALRPDNYHAAEAAAAKSSEQARTWHDQVDQLRRQHSKIEKLVRAWPQWWLLQQRRNERNGVVVPPGIPTDVRQQYLEICKELKSVAEEQTLRRAASERATKGLEALQLHPLAVSQQTEIKLCLELRQSAIEAKQDLPQRQRSLQETQLRIDRELAELRPGWGHTDLQAFVVDAATQHEIDRIHDEFDECKTALTKLTTKRESDADNLSRTRAEHCEIGTQREVTSIEAVLAGEAEFFSHQKQWDDLRGELAKLERKLATQSRKLTPPLADTTPSLHELPVPRAESVAHFETRFADLLGELRTVKASLADDESQQREIEKTLATSLSGRNIPSLGERDSARQRRNQGWSLVHQKYIAAENCDSVITAWLSGAPTASLPESYERSVRQADEIADQIFENAHEVAQREGLNRQLNALNVRIDDKRKKVNELERQQSDLHTQWDTLWKPCGLQPLAPEAMLGWLHDHRAACETIARRDELVAEQSSLSGRLAAFEQRLRIACGETIGDVATLLISSRETVRNAKDQLKSAADLQKEVRRLEQQLTKHDAALHDLATRETAAKSQWKTVLQRLQLPEEWDTALARDVISKLTATRVRLDSLPGEEARIAAMNARIAEFDQRVQAICQAIAPERLPDPTELALKSLDESAELAVEAQRKHDALSQELDASHEAMQSLRNRLEEYHSRRTHLFKLAETTTDTEFLEVVSRAENAFQLDCDIDQLIRDVNLIRAGEDRDEFESSLLGTDIVILRGQEGDLAEQLKLAEAERKVADGAEALARDALARLNGSEEVAILNERLAQQRSQLAAEVDRYMPLVYARHLLNSAVTRFEQENQPEMIATVSRLLSQMTGGKYVQFDRSGGGQKQVLIRRADRVEFTPDQLSTGTREQLFLAIRLAYVLHYCQGNQPLPIVIDDVLVNFDAERTRQTLVALADISQTVQVLFFTCHRHVVDLAREVVPGLMPVELPTSTRTN